MRSPEPHPSSYVSVRFHGRLVRRLVEREDVGIGITPKSFIRYTISLVEVLTRLCLLPVETHRQQLVWTRARFGDPQLKFHVEHVEYLLSLTQ